MRLNWKRLREALTPASPSRATLREETQAHVEKGNVLYAAGELAGARTCYEAAIALDPRNARARFNLGVVLHQLGLLQDAAREYAAALELQPHMAKALVNWGNLRKDTGDLDGAAELYGRATALDPRDPHALNNLASIAHERGDFGEAERLYTLAAEADESFVDPRYNLAVIALRKGDFEKGWEGYELRFRTRPAVVRLDPSSLPRARAEDLKPTARIAVPVERGEGLGDQLLFSTLLPELVSRVGHAVVQVDSRLLDAFRRSMPAATFVGSYARPPELDECDFQIPMGSLAGLFRRGPQDFTRQPRRLFIPDPGRVREVRGSLPARGVTGISWHSFQGRGRKHVQNRKSIPLEVFGLLAGPATTLLDLQYGDLSQERAAFDARHPGLRREIEGLDRFNDLDGVMAAIAACDLVVTTSNVTAHLAGAIGARTWLVYLRGNAPFHYWVPGPDGRSLWYPSVEILTDPSWTTWETAFRAIAARRRNEA